jgi:hypothetical protein
MDNPCSSYSIDSYLLDCSCQTSYNANRNLRLGGYMGQQCPPTSLCPTGAASASLYDPGYGGYRQGQLVFTDGLLYIVTANGPSGVPGSSSDFALVSQPEGATGPRGDRGVQGAQGTQGIQGPTGLQ